MTEALLVGAYAGQMEAAATANHVERTACRCGPPPELCLPDDTELTQYTPKAGIYRDRPRADRDERGMSVLIGKYRFLTLPPMCSLGEPSRRGNLRRPKCVLQLRGGFAKRGSPWCILLVESREVHSSRLLERLAAVVQRRFPGQRANLVLGGGCALNIKWNALIRASGLFQDVFVPPFPNDAGAAIGTAVCESFQHGNLALEWDVYSGPSLAARPVPEGWQTQPCDERQLAQLLHAEDEPVVVLSGRAELGPRALGNRSILAPATDPRMKARLNAIKNRADYRPVAPICLENHAHEVFTPGTPDPYMLFEHRMRHGWAERVPAIVHRDGTARLQTIDERSNSAGRILAAYTQISGVPVLCNTSANFEGRGFFPDVASAAQWKGTRYIWSENVLYTNPGAP